MTNKNMIGFSSRSHKFLSKLFCRHFRHCAIITYARGTFTMHQFANGKIHKIALRTRDIKILENHGWVFVPIELTKTITFAPHDFTCVQFAKRNLGIKNIFIQTPDGLYKTLAAF